MNILNEVFSSKKLAAMAKQHGGIDISRNGGIRDGARAFFGGSSVDLSKITDDMLSGEPFEYDYLRTPDRVSANLIHFKDGYAISLKPYDLKRNDNINPAEPRKKPSRYGTGIGDTGDHDKKESPFFKNGKKDIGPEYNGFGVSTRAGESQHYRDAFNSNKRDFEYFKNHPESEYSKDGMRRAASNMETIRGYGRNLLNKSRNENRDMKQTITLNESQLKQIVAESVKKVLKESEFDAPKNIRHWYDDVEHTYKVGAMIKSDMNPVSHKFNATSIEEAIEKATNYFVGYSSTHNKKDVDIFYIAHDDYGSGSDFINFRFNNE